MHKTATKTAFSNSYTFSSGAEGMSGASRGKYHTSGPPIPPKSGMAGFFEAFGKEVRKDLGIGK